jgi:hypothetical protein
MTLIPPRREAANNHRIGEVALAGRLCGNSTSPQRGRRYGSRPIVDSVPGGSDSSKQHQNDDDDHPLKTMLINPPNA